MNSATQQALQKTLYLVQQTRFNEAEQSLSRIREVSPGVKAQVAFLKGIIAQKQGQLDKATAAFELAVDCDKAHWQAHNHHAICCKKQQLYQQALNSYQLALEYCPDSATGEILKNCLILFSYYYNEAEADIVRSQYASLIERQPVLKKLWADIDKAQNRWKAAAEGYKAAIHLNPDYGFAYHNLAQCCLNMGDAEQAIEHLKNAIKVQPQQAENWESLADAYVAQGELDQAEHCYAQALALEPERVSAHNSINELYWQSDQLSKFGLSFEQVLAKDPNNKPVRYAYIDTLVSAKQDQKAMAIVDTGLRKGMDNQLWHFKAKLHGRHAEFDASLEAFERGYNEDVSLEYLQDKAQMELKVGKFSEVKHTLEVASKRAPNDQLTIALWGTLWRQQEDSRYQWLNDYDSFVKAYELPVPEGYSELSQFLRELKSELLSLYRFSQAPLKQTLVNGAQLPGRLFAQPYPLVQSLVISIRQVVESYINELPDDSEHPLLRRKANDFWFSGSWSVKLVPDGYHVAHVHPAGWISSSCYIHLPECMEQQQGEPQQGAIQFGASPLELGALDEPELTVMPKAGMVVLFPSYMWHRTVPFGSDNPDEFRLTTPFDVSVGDAL